MDEVLVVVFMALPMDRVQQRFVVQTTSFLLLFTLVEGVLLEVFKASPRDRAQQRFVVQTTSFLLLFTLVEVLVEILVEVFKGLPRDKGSTAVCGADNVVSSASQGRGGGARGGLPGLSQGQGSSAGFWTRKRSTFPFLMVVLEKEVLNVFLVGQSSTASAFEQTSSHAPHRSLPQAPVHGRHDEWVCVVDVENDNEYYWNRWDNTTCWRLPRGVKHRWCRLPSGLYMDVVLGKEFSDLPPL